MTPQEHREIAERLLTTSDSIFANDKVLGSEALWGAAIHSVNAVAMQKGLRHGQYRHKAAAVRRIAEDHRAEGILIEGFAAARSHLHVYFDKVHLRDDDLLRHRAVVREFVSQMLAILGDIVISEI